MKAKRILGLCSLFLALHACLNEPEARWAVGLTAVGLGVEHLPMAYGSEWSTGFRGQLLCLEGHWQLAPGQAIELQLPLGTMAFFGVMSAVEEGFMFPIQLAAYHTRSWGTKRHRLRWGAGLELELFLSHISRSPPTLARLTARPTLSLGYEYLWNRGKQSLQIRARPYLNLGTQLAQAWGNPPIGVGFTVDITFLWHLGHTP